MNRGARRGTLSPLQCSFNYGKGESSQGADKVEYDQQNNPNQLIDGGKNPSQQKETLFVPQVAMASL